MIQHVQANQTLKDQALMKSVNMLKEQLKVVEAEFIKRM